MKKITKLFFVGILCLASLVCVLSLVKPANKVKADGQDTAEFDSTIDTVSLSDLTWGGSKGHTTTADHSDVNATYDKTSTNGSLVLKFKYNVVQADGGDSVSFCVYTGVESNIWNDANGHVLLLRQDGIYMLRYKEDKFSYKNFANGLSAGTHDVEFGRVYLTSGANQGKYYSYVKIDGTLIAESYNLYDTTKVDNRIFFHFSAGNTQNNIYDAYGYEDAKIIDISDLSTNTKTITMDGSKNLTYDNSDHKANYSIVFRFKYTPNGSNQVHLSCDGRDEANSQDYIWDTASSFILANDSGTTVHLGKSTSDNGHNGYHNIDYTMTTGTTYDVEFGRLAKMMGTDATGVYKVYLKINGEIVKEDECGIPETILKGNRVFITGSNNSVFTDVAPADVFETADIISVSSLKSNNELVGNTTVMNDTLYYTYEAKAAHKSFVYKVKYTVDEVKSGDSGYFQLCFGQSWTANTIWVRADKTFLKDDGNGYVKSSSKAFTEAKTYNLEFGKIYVTEGKHVGTYYLYLKVDGALQVEYYTSNSYNNNALFNNKSGATQVWTDICADGHTLGTQVVGQASTCSVHGTLSYYECSVCGKKLADAEGTQVLTSLVAPLGQHTVEGGVCTVCGATSNPEFTTVKDADRIELTTPIDLWKYTDAVIEFDSSKSSLTIDLVSPIRADRISEKKALTGTEVNGIDGIYYHYSFTVKDLAVYNSTGYETVNVMRFRCAGDYANFTVTGYVNPFETADEISVKDLFYLNGKAAGKVATFNTTGGLKFQYNTTAEHKSVIFSFKYGITEIPSKADYSYGQFHFLDGWSSNCLWPRNDKTFIKKDGDGYAEGSKIFTEAGEKTITYGKVYIKSGDLTGKYYLFIKADGVLIDQFVTANDYNNNKMFCTLDDGSKWYDLSYVPDTYEEADVISVGDLSYNGQQNCNIMTLDAHKTYSYTATAEHKSVIFKYSMTVSEIPEKADYDYGQIHFTDGWSSNCLWIRGDNTFIQKDGDAGYASSHKIFSEVGTKIIEVGKLYIVSGENAGKYYIYIKANNELVVDYLTDNVYDKNSLFFTGNDGRKLYSFDYVECADTHTLVKNDAVAATCDTDGVVEYYWCSNCGKNFADAQGTQELTSLVAPKHHTLGTLVSGTAPTCVAEGTYDYYECESCHKKFADAEATQELTSLIAPIDTTNHTLGSQVPAVVGDCDTDGVLAYYECTLCHKKYSDAEATQELTSIVAPKHHTLGSLVPAVPATCDTDGTLAYYECTSCHKYFADVENTQELTSLVDAKHHTLDELVPGVAATCKAEGTLAYYECTACHKYFADVDGTQQLTSLVEAINPANHSLGELVPAVAANCIEEGTLAYYECTLCQKKFADSEGTQELTSLVAAINPTNHKNVVHHEAVAESCYTLGNIEYYECKACHKYFSDEACTIEISNYVIGKHHTLAKVEAVEADCKNAGSMAYYHCSVCGNNFLYENGSMQIDIETDIAVPAHHTLTKIEAVAATCKEEGNIEYYRCSECSKYFNEEGEQLATSDLITPVAEHTFDEGVCTVCGEADPNYVEPSIIDKAKDLPGEAIESIKGLVPESLMAGCQSSLSITGIIFALGLAGIVLKKKREEE